LEGKGRSWREIAPPHGLRVVCFCLTQHSSLAGEGFDNYCGKGVGWCILLKYLKKYFDVHHLELRTRLFELEIMGCRKSSVSSHNLIPGLGDTRSAISSLDISLEPVSPCSNPLFSFPSSTTRHFHNDVKLSGVRWIWFLTC
jgi:hypothetical protein